ncbi:MAG: hypothetical protein ACLFQ5_01205 [Oceanicaulis sp.]
MRLIALAAALMLAACTPPVQGARDPALVTVFHAGGETRAAAGLFDRYALSGPGEDFTVGDLAALPARGIETGYPQGAEVQHWSGPRLSALLAAVDAAGSGARLTAVDGYQATVTAEEIAQFDPILATARDGAPLALGGFGPAILIWPRDTDPELSDMTDDKWPWAVFAVEVLEPEDG